MIKLSEIIARGGYICPDGWIVDPACEEEYIHAMQVEKDVDIPPYTSIAEQRRIVAEFLRQKEAKRDDDKYWEHIRPKKDPFAMYKKRK